MSYGDVESPQRSTRHLGAGAAFAILIGYFLTQYLSSLVISFIGGVAIGIVGGDENPNNLEDMYRVIKLLSFGVSLIASGVVIYHLAWYFSGGRMTEGAPNGIGLSLGSLPHIITGILGGVLGASLVVIVADSFPSKDNLPPDFFSQMFSSTGWIKVTWVFLLVVFLAPLEEFLFRGVLFAGLSYSWGRPVAGVVVTGLFVLGHLPHTIHYLPATVVVLIGGILALVLRMRANSLGPAIALHSTYNFFIVLWAYYFSSL